MKSVAGKIQKVLRENIDSAAWVWEHDASGELSPFLAGLFSVYVASMLGTEVFFVERTGDVDDYVALRRQLAQLDGALGVPHGGHVVYFADTLPKDVRRSFLEAGTPFATAENDFFIPFLALRINANRQRTLPTIRRFTGSDQSVYLFGLYAEGSFTQDEVVRATGLSVGSVSRALSNLVLARALDYEVGGKTGRRKSYFRADDQVYYQAGREFFGEAVEGETATDARPVGAPTLTSGLSALALTNDLLVVSKEVLAVAPQYKSRVVATAPHPVHGLRYSVQVLRYDPAPFAVDGHVDPFTMLMTIPPAARSDERVRIALREVLKGCAWYED